MLKKISLFDNLEQWVDLSLLMIRTSFLDANYFGVAKLSLFKYGNYLIDNLNQAQWKTLSQVLQLNKQPYSGFLLVNNHQYLPLQKIKFNLCEEIDLRNKNKWLFPNSFSIFLKQDLSYKKDQNYFNLVNIPKQLKWFLGFNALNDLFRFSILKIENVNQKTSKVINQFFTSKFINSIYFEQVDFEYNNFLTLIEKNERELVDFNCMFFNQLFTFNNKVIKSFFERYYALNEQKNNLKNKLKIAAYEAKSRDNSYFEKLQIERAKQRLFDAKKTFSKQHKNALQLINSFTFSLIFSGWKIKWRSFFNFYRKRILEKKIVSKRIKTRILLLKEIKKMDLLSPKLLVETIDESINLVNKIFANIQNLYQEIISLKSGPNLNWKYQTINQELKIMSARFILTKKEVHEFLIKARLSFIKNFVKQSNNLYVHEKLVNELKENILLNQNHYRGKHNNSFSVLIQKTVFKQFIDTVQYAIGLISMRKSLETFNFAFQIKQYFYESLLANYQKINWQKYELNNLYFVLISLWNSLSKKFQQFFNKYEFLSCGSNDFIWNEGRSEPHFSLLKDKLKNDLNSPKWNFLVDKVINKYLDLNFETPVSFLLASRGFSSTTDTTNKETKNDLKQKLKKCKQKYKLLLKDINLVKWIFRDETNQKLQKIKFVMKRYCILNKTLHLRLKKTNKKIKRTFFIDSEECNINRLEASNKLYLNVLNSQLKTINFFLRSQKNLKKLNFINNINLLINQTKKNGISSWMLFSDLNKINKNESLKLYLLFKLLLNPKLLMINCCNDFTNHAYNFIRGLLISYQNKQGIALIFNDPNNKLVKNFSIKNIDFETGMKK